MSKKDFSNLDLNPVYSAIQTATQEQEKQENTEKPIVLDAQETQKKRKERKTYTEQEKQEFLSTGETAGRKGIKAARINMAFTAKNYEYIQILSRVCGMTLTEFVNAKLDEMREQDKALYEQAVKFKNSI